MEDCKRNPQASQGDNVIIPTAEFDPMFADDGISFRTKMIEYIEREFADLLGNRVGPLCSDQGLEILANATTIDRRNAARCGAA